MKHCENSEKKKYTLDDAVELLKQKYEYALRQKWINSPLCWALFHTWSEVDRARLSAHKED